MKYIIILLVILLVGCGTMKTEITKVDKSLDKATFAGGCFWCMEAAFENVNGVKIAVSGYTGGSKEDAVYEKIGTGTTGHYESVQVIFDPKVVSYSELVETFWRQIDPTDSEGQFADKGSQYKTAIFYHNASQKKIAEESKKRLEDSKKFDKPIVTQILQAKEFYLAEEYHQDYAQKRVVQYKLYESGSGRKDFKEEVWK